MKHPPRRKVRATVTLHIENCYEFGGTIVTTPKVTIPLPPKNPAKRKPNESWQYAHIFAHTGTGRTYGDAAYFVEIVKSTVPELVGRTYEFGL